MDSVPVLISKYFIFRLFRFKNIDGCLAASFDLSNIYSGKIRVLSRDEEA